MDAYAVTNPKRALKRREEEAEAAESPAEKKAAPAAEPGGKMRFGNGRPEPTPEKKAEQDARLREMQRRQRQGAKVL